MRGVDPASHQLDFVRKNLMVGDLTLQDKIFQEKRSLKEKPVGAVAIGATLAHVLQLGIGDPVVIISPHISEEKGITGKVANTEQFYVGGIFELGMNDFDTTMVLIDLPRAQQLFKMGERVSGLSVQLQNVDEADGLKEIVRSVLGPGYWVKSWQDMNRNFFSALKVEKAVMRILLTLIVTVAAFNIVSTLIMVVMEKTKEIGVLRALGATRSGIKSIFLLEGFTIGAFGTAIGGTSGYFIAKHINGVADIVERFTGFEVFPKDVYYFSQIPAEIIPSDIFFIIAFALLMALLAGLYPAHQAGKVSPVEAIRYE
jgi:lipoprotein-releasing system permease protein